MNSASTSYERPALADVKIVAFDLDDTLSPSKTPVSKEMAAAFSKLLDLREVLIISGGRFEQFQMQILDVLPSEAQLSNLHLMPTNGTRYLRFEAGQWKQIYFHSLSDEEIAAASLALEQEAKKLGLWEAEDRVAGERIENRGSQITFSALGQRAEVAAKHAWDPTGAKREALREAVAARLPELEVRAGGSTSVDITRKGTDKAYGMRALRELTGVELDQMLFIGDRLVPGGNDYPVHQIGVPCHAVSGPHETLQFVTGMVAAMKELDR